MSETPIKDSCQTVSDWYDNLTCEPSDNLWELIQQIDNKADKELTPAKALDLIYYYIWKRKCYYRKNPEIIICDANRAGPPLEAVFQRKILISPQVTYLTHKNLLFRKEDLEILQQLDPLIKEEVTGERDYKEPPKRQVYIEPDNDQVINDRFKPNQQLWAHILLCTPKYYNVIRPPSHFKFSELCDIVEDTIKKKLFHFKDEENPHLLHMRRHYFKDLLNCKYFYLEQLPILVGQIVKQEKLFKNPQQNGQVQP